MTLATEHLASTAATRANAPVACAHCANPVPAGLIEPGAADQFCCAGCRAVYQTLHACGLEAYYRLRDAAGEVSARPAREHESSFASFDSPTFHNLYVQVRPDGVATVDLALEGVTCAACVWLVERLPRVLPGVIEARLSLREATVRVTWDPAALPLSRVAESLDRFGYKPYPAKGGAGKERHQRETRRRLIHLGAAGALMGNSMLLGFALYAGDYGHMDHAYRAFFRYLSALLGAVALAWPGATFFRSAWAAIRAGAVNLDVPIAGALLVGGVAGLVNVVLGRGEIYFDSLSVLVFLLLVGRFIQYRQQRRADDAVGLLFSLTPSTCHVVRDGQVVDAPVEALRAGDAVEVRPGELFPADGLVESGRSTVNQALLTGESMPAPIAAGDGVCAGAQNVASVVRVRVERVGQETRVGRLTQLIERGVQDKPPIVQFTDRVGRWFVIVLSIVSAGVFAYHLRHAGLTAAIDHTVTLLIVTCPCVLGLATPLTIAIAIGRLARRDILVKSGAVLERLARGGDLLLDKTGTLTEGRQQLLGWSGDAAYQAIVAEVERNSNHPVGRALCEAFGAMELDADARASISDVIERGDGGVSAQVGARTLHVGSPRYVRANNVCIDSTMQAAVLEAEDAGATAVVVAVDGDCVGVAALGDRVRPDSAAAITRLSDAGWQPEILSGDASNVVTAIAAQVGVKRNMAAGELSPEEKLARVERRTPGRVTVMVGDGVNDAAALAAADVGIAVHGGAEASLSAADVYVARPGLQPLVELVAMSRQTLRTIHRNLAISLAYNLLAGLLAATGVMTPLRAAIIMPISSASVLALAVASVSRRGREQQVDAETIAGPREATSMIAPPRDAAVSLAMTGGVSWK